MVGKSLITKDSSWWFVDTALPRSLPHVVRVTDKVGRLVFLDKSTSNPMGRLDEYSYAKYVEFYTPKNRKLSKK